MNNFLNDFLSLVEKYEIEISYQYDELLIFTNEGLLIFEDGYIDEGAIKKERNK